MHSHQVVKLLQVRYRDYITDVHKINVSTAPRRDGMNVTGSSWFHVLIKSLFLLGCFLTGESLIC